MSAEYYFKAGYNDFWDARYNPPEDATNRGYYMHGYNQAEFDVAIGNY